MSRRGARRFVQSADRLFQDALLEEPS